MILNINKPYGWTSFDVVAKLRGVLGIKKVGHAGTLDPLSTGVLVILTGKDTKKQNELMDLDKEYLAKIAFGATSPTYDLEGDLTFSEKTPEITALRKKIEQNLSKYIGVYEQTVPPYSAVKVKGKKLYHLARKDQIVWEDLPRKEVTVLDISVRSFKVEEFQKNEESYKLPVLTCAITCTKGFYVRSFAHDFGEKLGVGAVLISLQRTRVGNYKIEDSREIKDIKNLASLVSHQQFQHNKT